MTTLHTAAEAAEQLGVARTTVTRRCASHGIGRRFGRQLMLTPREVARLAKLIQDGPGNPNFKPGNYFGGAKKRPRK